MIKKEVTFSGLATAFLTLSAFGALLGTLPKVPFPLILLAHFTHFYGPLLVVAAALLLALRRPKHAAFCLLLGIWNLGIIARDLAQPKPAAAEGPRLKIVLANVYTENNRHEEVEDWLLSQNADVIALLEINEAWWKSLDRIAAQYPYGKQLARSDNFGIALVSRLPLEDARFVNVGQNSIPSILARLQFAGEPLSILVTHPLPPVSSKNIESRNLQLKEAAVLAQLSMQGGEFILIGDLNVTPWSAPFRRLLEESGLRDGRAGFGFQGSWLMNLPLDHTLVSPGLAILERFVDASRGSDHRPVVFSIGKSLP
ncbi:MAG: hypothetical protein COB53_12755 [Elusimicrobia bacterium]|nr:MAG: hypothetical protein COB53_12755 [Elusimicrobiota bacterium]